MSAGATAASGDERDARSDELLREIRDGLSRPQKELPSKLFYDRRGSELFEEITRLPEYYLTRAERSLLVRHMPRWMARVRPRALVEFGAGNADKTRTILDAMQAEGSGSHYVPVDISAEFLQQSAAEIRRAYPELVVVPSAGDFTTGMDLPPNLPGPVVFTILGSTIGNFTPPEAVGLLRRIAAVMRPGDVFLLGADLRKDPAVLEAAYDDAAGVTAEFNLNVLRVMNREFGADFDLEAYLHRARYDSMLHRIEMHLLATREQVVHIPGAGRFRIHAGETIRTEISCKYDRRTVREIFAGAGLRLDDWMDDGRYALATAVPIASADSAVTPLPLLLS
jgi:L-histidine Nalpha-methyltransferase